MVNRVSVVTLADKMKLKTRLHLLKWSNWVLPGPSSAVHLYAHRQAVMIMVCVRKVFLPSSHCGLWTTKDLTNELWGIVSSNKMIALARVKIGYHKDGGCSSSRRRQRWWNSFEGYSKKKQVFVNCRIQIGKKSVFGFSLLMFNSGLKIATVDAFRRDCNWIGIGWFK